MIQEKIQEFYQIHSVRGIAIFDEERYLLDNQLPYSNNRIVEMVAPLFSLHLGLEQAKRNTEALVVRSSQETFVFLYVKSKYIFVATGKVETVDAIVSLAKRLPWHTMEGRVEQQTAEDVSAGHVTEEETVPEKSGGVSEEVWDSYRKDLIKMLSKVASTGQAQKMLERALEKVGLSGSDRPAPNELRPIGEAMVEAVPNKGRKKLVAKEFDILAGRHQL